jgi:glucose/arabinose dehydrogenase
MKIFSRIVASPHRIAGFLAASVSLFALLYIVSCGGGGGGGGGTQTVTLTRVLSGFNQPVSIANAGDGSGRLFIVEKSGIVRIVNNGAILPAPFLNITGLVNSSGGEQGLLGIAFPPNFAVNGRFYVDYTGNTGVVGDTVIARYTLTAPHIADSAGGVSILNVAQPFENHNGGQLAFGPDGFLYIAMGDGGSGGDPQNNGQSLTTLLGKILRIDVESGASTYTIPATNPFGTEIWAYGLRNPWRFSFDRSTGDLFIGDVGQNLFEEVNFQPAASPGGENYGWNIMEGSSCFNPATNCNQTGLTLPVTVYDHQAGDCAVIGGFVYRGTQFPGLQGMYIYGDSCSGRIWGLRFNGTAWISTLLIDTTLTISSFGEDEAGNLYVADIATGDIYSIGLR